MTIWNTCEDTNKTQDQELVVCLVCGAVEGVSCVEVFGEIQGKQLGCSACIGVSFFPYGKHMKAKFVCKYREEFKDEGKSVIVGAAIT